MLQNKSIKIFTLLGLLLSGTFAIDCPADTASQIDWRTLLQDGTPNPDYGQEIATGFCVCLDFASDMVVNADDSTVTLIIRILDNEPVRGMEFDIYHDAPGLVYGQDGSVAKGAKLENVTDPEGQLGTMTLLANEIGNHVKVMAYSTDKAQTAGNGEEDDLVFVTYKAVDGLEVLPSPINFGIGVCNFPGTSKSPDLLNVVCSFPDTLNPKSVNVTLNIVEKPGVPTRFNLAQNYPNPFNPTTNIAFDIPQNSHVTINIYNLIGQQVVTLVNKEIQAGRYEVEWNGLDANRSAVASGVYFYELSSENFKARKKMILLR